jgi:WD40 repeat protein
VAALGLTGVLTQWRRAEHQRTRAELQSQRAEANAAKERRERYYASIAAADSHIRNGDIDVALGLLTNCPAEFRHWEWGRLIYLCHQAISSTRVAPDQVDMLMVNADGTRAVEMPLHEKLARRSACWEVGTGREVFEVSGESSSVVAMAFSPDGQRFAAAQLNGQLRVWDARSGQLRSERHATNPVRSVLFSPDGERLAIVMSAGAGVILNPTNGQVLLATPSLGIEFRAAALDPAGRFWATMAQDGRITVRDARTGTERFSFQADPTANPLAFHSHPSLFLSPDGNRLLVNAAPNASRVWNLEASREILFIPSKVLGVAYSPDGSSVAVLSGGTSVDLWDLATGEKSSTIRAHQRRVTFVGFDASGARLRTASSDGTAKVWPALPGRERLPHTFHTDGVTYRPDGQRCVTTQADGVARVWDTASGRELFNFRGNWSWLRVASFSPDGQRIVTGGADRRARIFEADTGRELLVLTGHISSVRAAVFSPDGAKVATGSWDKTVRLWDAMTGAELLTLRGHADSVRRVVFSPDGQRLFSMAQDSKVNIWDTTTGRLLSTLSGGNNALAISPDGRRLVTGSFSGSVRLWNAMTGELLAKWNARGAVPVLDFSPDGRRLLVVTTDPNGVLIKPNQEIWEAETGRPLLVMPEDSAVFSARFSPDGHRILSGSFYARAARVWEAFPWEERLYDSRSSRREEAQTSTRNAERGTRNKDQSLVTSAPTPLVDRIQAYAAEYWRARLAAEDQVRAPTPAPSPEPLRFPKTAWPTRASDASPRLLDLTPYYNALLNVPWELVPAESAYDDDLSSLPTGIVTLSGVAFDVRGLVRLATAPDPFWKGAVFIPHPTSIEGIPVANQWRRLHVLHGADRTAIADGAPICRYVLRYADGERREIPVLYGRDVRTLWQLDNDIKPGDRGVVAWLGTNPAIARLDGRLRLYRSTFDNPRPEVPIQSIDVVSSLTQCIPFIIAITLEP